MATGFFIEDGVGAFSRVDGEESVSCHLGYVLGKNSCRIDYNLRIDDSAVGGNTLYGGFAVIFLCFHGKHRCVKADLCAVVYGIFGQGDGKSVRADHSGTVKVKCEFGFW